MSKSQQSLGDVLSLLALEAIKPTAALVNEYRERYPEYADAIADFALQLTLDALLPEPPEMEPECMAGPPSDIVMSAISNFQNLRFQVEKGARSIDAQPAQNAESGAPAVNPYARLTPPEFRQLVRDFDVSTQFFLKIRDRQIIATTIPTGFTQHFARASKVDPAILIAHLAAQQSSSTSGKHFKATGKPVNKPQQSFEEAVRTSALSPEQQERLLKFTRS